MAKHHAVGICCQRNSGYRPSSVNIMAQGLSTPDPSLSPTHLCIRRGRATTTHYTHHQVSLMVLCNTTLVPSLGLYIGPACEAGLSAGMQRERVPAPKDKVVTTMTPFRTILNNFNNQCFSAQNEQHSMPTNSSRTYDGQQLNANRKKQTSNYRTYFMTYFCLLSQHSVWSEITSHNPLH